MSESEPVIIDGDSFSTPINSPSEPEDPLAAPDPLLGSGSFIAPNNGVAAADQNVESKETPTPKAEAENDKIDLTKNGDDEDADLSAKRARPDWLPADFKMTLKKRTSGATVGSIDRYYIAPTGLRLRSKREVLTFLETGGKRKKPSTPNSDEPASEGSAPRSSKKKTVAKKKVHTAFKFDFKNPPEKVSWRLTYASEDTWSPSIGDMNLPIAAKQEWASVFNQVCQN
ncbi:methyl-CpG-binding domain-containing protein 5-like [Rutidosis leptorrhynchoides]|uniref:methyl-CpG-binding domain-containing protein 5-like n=1 Tax=Rutidosis leptorrhynchoides TaxID=125765 RepID=UPI003A98F572